jgi:hypothetical protein
MVKIRTLKRPWAYCQNDSEHGKNTRELIITIGDYKRNWWLCDDCLNELQLEMECKVAEVLEHEVE